MRAFHNIGISCGETMAFISSLICPNYFFVQSIMYFAVILQDKLWEGFADGNKHFLRHDQAVNICPCLIAISARDDSMGAMHYMMQITQ